MLDNSNISNNNELLVASVEKIDTSIGERTRIVYVDTTALLRGSRLADELFASVMTPGQKVQGRIIKAKVKQYSFKDSETGEDITANVAPIVQLGQETLEQAVKANGKQMPPLSLDKSAIAPKQVAQAQTAPAEEQTPVLDPEG